MSIYSAPYGAAQGAGDEPPRPPVVREQVVASKAFFEQNSQAQINDAANIILAKHWGDISQFMLGQRQMGIILPASYKTKHYSDLMVQYQRLGNQEMLTLTAFPDVSNPNPEVITVDLNYDGYIAWGHYQDAQDTAFKTSKWVGPFDIFLNGYAIRRGYAINQPLSGFVILFGPTALAAQSLQDKPKLNFALKGLSKGDTPRPVLPPPGWGDYPAMTARDGEHVDKITKELGYWIFDWTNVHNPAQYTGSQVGNHPWNFTSLRDIGAGVFTLTEGIQFEDASKSPLEPKKPNYFGVQLSPDAIGNSEIELDEMVIAEFYDRNQMRTVSQSWKFNGNISVNDSPMIWGGMTHYNAFASGVGLEFDLTPGKSDAIYSKDPTQTNTGNFLSDADQAAVKAYHDLVAVIFAHYEAAVAAAEAVVNTKWASPANQKLLNQARNVEHYISEITDANGNWIHGEGSTTGDPTGNDLEYVRDHGVDFFGPPQKYWYDWNIAPGSSNPLPPAGFLFRCRFDVSTQNILVEENPPPDPSLYGGSFADDPGPTSIQELIAWAKTYIPTDPVQQYAAELKAADASVPVPVLPPKPHIGKDITNFKQRKVTINGTTWSYGTYG